MTKSRRQLPRRVDPKAVPSREWEWNQRGPSHDGVNTFEGCLTWYSTDAMGGGASSQPFEEFLEKGPPVEAPASVVAELHALLVPLSPASSPAERLRWAAQMGDAAAVGAALGAGADPEGAHAPLGTALEIAVRAPHPKVIDALVARGAHISGAVWNLARDERAVDALVAAGGATGLDAEVRALGGLLLSASPAAGARARRALDALCAAADRGQDLRRFEADLIAGWSASHDSNDWVRLAHCVVADCVRAQDGRRLARAMGELEYPHGLAEELERLARAGRDVGPLLRDLIEGLGPSLKDDLLGDRLERAVVAHLFVNDAAELEKTAGLLEGWPAFLYHVVRDLHRSGRDTAPALPAVARVLERSGAAATPAADAFGAVAGAVDLSAYRPLLRARMKTAKGLARRAAAITLAAELLRPDPPDWAELDALRTARDANVRQGVIVPLAAAIRRGRSPGAAASRLALLLLDADGGARAFAARTLAELLREGRAPAPDAQALERAAAGLGDAAKGAAIASLLHGLAAAGDDGAHAVASALAGRKDPAAGEILRAAQGYLQGRLRRPCSICTFLRPHDVFSNEVHLPPEALRLQPAGEWTADGERERRCPECGNWYLSSYESEEDHGSLDETFTLTRVRPQAVLERAGAQRADELRPQVEAAERRLHDDLEHPHPKVRAQAEALLAERGAP